MSAAAIRPGTAGTGIRETREAEQVRDESSELAVGVDAGGTATRALLVDARGSTLGSGRSGGANPNAHPPAEAAAHIVEAVTAALAGIDPARVRACVVGMAGASKLTDPAIAAVFAGAWSTLGLGAEVRTVSDAEAAFASATTEPDGTVLIAGTGSIAARIRGRRTVSTAGGYGWLLGDEGSGYWIGREAVRATLAALNGGPAEHGELTRAVVAEALGEPAPDEPGRRTAHRLITLVNGEPPIRLARFAPLVSAASGDRAAEAIIEDAASALLGIAMATRDPGEQTPVVLVGSVLGEGSPVGARVRDRLAHGTAGTAPAAGAASGTSGIEAVTSCDGVSGATWLAAVDAFGEHAPRPALG